MLETRITNVFVVVLTARRILPMNLDATSSVKQFVSSELYSAASTADKRKTNVEGGDHENLFSS